MKIISFVSLLIVFSIIDSGVYAYDKTNEVQKNKTQVLNKGQFMLTTQIGGGSIASLGVSYFLADFLSTDLLVGLSYCRYSDENGKLNIKYPLLVEIKAPFYFPKKGFRISLLPVFSLIMPSGQNRQFGIAPGLGIGLNAFFLKSIFALEGIMFYGVHKGVQVRADLTFKLKIN